MSYDAQKNPTCRIFFLIIVVLGVLITGCASTKTSKQAKTESDVSTGPKMIKNIQVLENAESINVVINGDKSLTYTTVKQTTPPAIKLYFSETSIDAPKVSFLPQSDIIDSVKASQLREKARTSELEITLRKDIRPDFYRQGTELVVSFSKMADVPPEPSKTIALEPGDKREPVGYQAPARTATRLHSVYATKLEDGLKVFVGADGAITNYKAFTIGSPARIVFDIFNLKSPYNNEKLVPVNTQWVKRVRYYGYPDRLRLVLDTDKEYISDFSAYPVDNGLLIHVGKEPGYVSTLPRTSVDKSIPQGGFPKASRIQSVYATQLNDSTLVTVMADGSISDYKTYTINNPPSIVVDMFDLKSPYHEEQSFPVDTKWIKRVRHNSYPDRQRIYIETSPAFLTAYNARQERDGLVIRIGGEGTAAMYTPPESYSTVKGKKVRYNYEKPAWVNRIDFISEDAGRSTLILGATRPVEHEMVKLTPNSLRLKMMNTKIPKYRRRPLITTRFESAVDKINPVQVDSSNSTINIELRESVPYFVEQNDGLLMVHFEASSISPKPIAQTTDTLAKAASPQAVSAPVESLDSGAAAAMDAPDAPLQPVSPISPSAVSVPEHLAQPATIGKPPAGDFQSSPFADLFQEAPPQYTGEKIALDFFETDIKNVFRILREVSGKNFAIDKDVDGKVTLTLEHPVPWDQVLDLILKMNQLGKTLEGDIIRIATRTTLKREEEERQKKLKDRQTLEEQKKALEPIRTEYISINYSDADAEIKPHLEAIITKERGSISVDKRTNTVILTDTENKIRQAKEIVERLDKVTPQVMIEARIVEANTTFSRTIGTQWGIEGGFANEDDAAGIGPQRGFDIFGGTYGYNMAVNLPPTDTSAAIGFNFMRIAGSPLSLNAAIAAMESEGGGKIISAPKILTLDNKEATIKQGLEVPYQTIDDDGQPEIQFKNVDLLLKVTPHITPDNRISMRLEITNNEIATETGDIPALTTKEARTELLVNDGDTVVIGGILKSTKTYLDKGLPGLSKIPLLGWFFKTESESERKEELLIFITPRIVQLEQR